MHKQETSIFHNIFPPKVESKPDPETGYYNPFPAFPFAGPLRPVYPLSEKREVPKSIPRPDYAADGIPKAGRSMRANKVDLLDATAQEKMRKVCRLAREVLDVAAAALRPGITTDEIDEIVHKACIERDVSSSGPVSTRVLTKMLKRLLVLPVSAELQPFSQVCMHVHQRGYLPRYSR